MQAIASQTVAGSGTAAFALAEPLPPEAATAAAPAAVAPKFARQLS